MKFSKTRDHIKGNTGKEISYPRGVPGTLVEAKRMAEEDHERRCKACHVEAKTGTDSSK